MHLISLRHFLLSVVVALGAQATQSLAAHAAGEPKRVVFVCAHGSVKSLVAAVYFNRLAGERGLPYRAMARGTAPDSTVPAPVVDGLHTDGFDVAGFVPRLLRESDIDGIALIVSFDEDITKTVGTRAPYLKWDDLPGVLSDYPRGRVAIVSQVDALVEALARGSP